MFYFPMTSLNLIICNDIICLNYVFRLKTLGKKFLKLQYRTIKNILNEFGLKEWFIASGVLWSVFFKRISLNISWEEPRDICSFLIRYKGSFPAFVLSFDSNCDRKSSYLFFNFGLLIAHPTSYVYSVFSKFCISYQKSFHWFIEDSF